MTKSTITLLLLFVSACSWGQSTRTYGTWIYDTSKFTVDYKVPQKKVVVVWAKVYLVYRQKLDIYGYGYRRRYVCMLDSNKNRMPDYRLTFKDWNWHQ
jgi:hypothetical protein